MKKEGRYVDARAVARIRFFGKTSINPKDWDSDKRDISRDAVYNTLLSYPVCLEEKIASETRRQADQLFDEICNSLDVRKMNKKREYFRHLFHAAKRAMHGNGCIRYSRNRTGFRPIIKP